MTLDELLSSPEFVDAYRTRRAPLSMGAGAAPAARPASPTVSIEDFQRGLAPAAPAAAAPTWTPAVDIVDDQSWLQYLNPFDEASRAGNPLFEGKTSRLALGSIDNPEVRLKLMQDEYGPENVRQLGDSFEIRDPTTGSYRPYNPAGFDVGDVVSVVPELVGALGGVAGEIGGAIGGAAATPFTAGIVNPITGAIAGGAAGYTGAKQGTKALISGLYDLPEDDVGEGLTTDLILGGLGPAVGPAARLAYRGAIKPAAGAVLDVVDPFRMAAQGRAAAGTSTDIGDILMNPALQGLTQADRNAIVANVAGINAADQTAADVLTDFGALNTSARMGEGNRLRAAASANRYGTAVEDLITNRVGMTGITDPLGTAAALGREGLAQNEALRTARSALYDPINPRAPVNLEGAAQALARRAARSSDPNKVIADSPLAAAIYDLADQATRRDAGAPLFRTTPESIPTRPGMTQAELDQIATRNFGRRSLDTVPAEDVIARYREPDVGFKAGLRGPALELQQTTRQAVLDAIPELRTADVAARKYSNLTTAQKPYFKEDAAGNFTVNESRLSDPFVKALDTGSVNQSTVDHLTDLFDAGVIKGEGMVDLADNLIAAMGKKGIDKGSENVRRDLLSISAMRSNPNLIGQVYDAAGVPLEGTARSAKAWLARQGAPSSVRRTGADVAAGPLPPTAAEEAAAQEVNRRLIEANVAQAAAQRNAAFNPVRATSNSAANDVLAQAGIVNALTHPVRGLGMLWSARGAPFLKSQALTKSTRAKDALIRRAAERNMRQEAASRAGTSLPGMLREFSPAYRSALQDVSAERLATVGDVDAILAGLGRGPSGLATPQLESVFSNLRKPISDPSELAARGAFSAWRQNQ